MLKTREDLLATLESMLGKHPDGMDAYKFILAYGTFCHAVDDIVDEKITEPEVLLKTFTLYSDILTSPFYRKYWGELHPILSMINNNYADSVIFERSSEQWKKDHADSLRTCGNDIAVHIVHMLCGYDDSRRLSLLFREDSYLNHHDANGNPV